MIKTKSIQIVISFYEFLSRFIKFVKMFYLKFFTINKNIISKIIAFIVYNCILIKSIYNLFINQIIVNCL